MKIGKIDQESFSDFQQEKARIMKNFKDEKYSKRIMD